MKLLVCESPGKIKKLQSLLGRGWIVKASMGHIRELANDGEYALGFELETDRIHCRYVPRDQRSQEAIAQLRAAAQTASEVVLATDPDREGETIAWHIKEVLQLKSPQRVVYTEITEAAVKAAIAHPRPLDLNLIAAGRCRDCLDKLVGYRGSPLVWALNNGAKSVGRVQSATLHLICERERDIVAFEPRDYWSVFVDYGEGLRAFYWGDLQSQTEAETHDDADPTQSPLTPQAQPKPESTKVWSQAEADQLVATSSSHPHQVVHVAGKLTSKQPPPPFTTSSLQQAAGAKLRFSPEQTMKVAQHLYEKGLITYMRTDSVVLSPEFCGAVRQWLQQRDPQNLPERVTQHRSRKTAQEAHEAIRPTDLTRASAQLQQELNADQFQLYLLIWKRAVASQCKAAVLRKTRIITQSGPIRWQARGQTLEFAGYTRYWPNLKGDTVLPAVVQGQVLTLDQATHQQKQTQPPPRYTEPKLVQLMERRGIGRPSTYAPTIATLKQRTYVELVKGNLQPTALGLEVDGFLAQALPDLLEADFTAQMEATLDAIAEGKEDWQRYLIDWNHSYFIPALTKAQQVLPASSQSLRPQSTLPKSRTKCPQCQQPLSKVSTKKVKKGYFLKCEQGCQLATGQDLVLFWSDSDKQWHPPRPQSTAATTHLTAFPCPVCGQPLEVYSYTKDCQAKALLRCSGPNAKGDRNHQDVVFFPSRGVWWSQKFGEYPLDPNLLLQEPTTLDPECPPYGTMKECVADT